ncbi:BMP family ABC transporter substrate-binding protein [Actinokineospora auranticolor]|uniref:Basic membrane protein A n=1 Tax=Actinokineospora auranticolor TaxID=155976 RepID=A0A2S6GWW7_9PSEU|nr:BMP family ABC transporter substrate-binding protein [Actinokineospora auranticolor]PPK69703.1 basic membrane protein A [Actinokineospora auranticolor]
MRRTRGVRLAAALLALGIGLAGCGAKNNDTGSGGGTPTSGAPAAGLKIGLAYDIGGRGDQSFNDSAARGLDKAKTEFGLDVKELEATAGETEAQKEDRLRQLVEGGYTTVVAVGFAYAEAIGKVAKDSPEVKFAIIDDFTDGVDTGANIANLTFAEQEGSFLVGVAAALKSKTGNVGFVGGVNTPLIQKFEVGYTAGVKAVKADATVQVKYLTQPPDFTGFNDPAKGETAAKGMFDAGADVVYAAAGGSGNGVFKTAKANSKWGIGVDSDQYNQPALAEVKDVIITSMIKEVDVAVYDFISSVKNGSFKAGQKVYDLKAGGIDYATSGGKIDDIKAKIDEYKAKIVSGEIKVADKK